MACSCMKYPFLSSMTGKHEEPQILLSNAQNGLSLTQWQNGFIFKKDEIVSHVLTVHAVHQTVSSGNKLFDSDCFFVSGNNNCPTLSLQNIDFVHAVRFQCGSQLCAPCGVVPNNLSHSGGVSVDSSVVHGTIAIAIRRFLLHPVTIDIKWRKTRVFIVFHAGDNTEHQSHHPQVDGFSCLPMLLLL